MTADQTIAPTLVQDELQAVVAMLCARFPERSRRDVETLVTDVHQRLTDNARIHSHLIPLTLNRCRRILAERRFVERHSGPKVHATRDFGPQIPGERSNSVDLDRAAV